MSVIHKRLKDVKRVCPQGCNIVFLCSDIITVETWRILSSHLFFFFQLKGAGTRPGITLCGNKHFQISITHLLGIMGPYSGEKCSWFCIHTFLLLDPPLVWTPCKRYWTTTLWFTPMQANVSPIAFDYLGYFFLRYGEYKKQRESCFSLAQGFLSELRNG
jgi:hypothetical protein